MEELVGGRTEAIFRDRDRVIRPRNIWTPSVHQLLEHYTATGITETPVALKLAIDTETLSYVEGNTFNYPLSGAITSLKAITSAAELLRKLHDASASFVKNNDIEKMDWMLVTREPVEVICHGDYTPYNVALNGEKVTGVFDFDTAHPASRVWDVAFSIYCWAPFKTNPIDKLGTLNEQLVRAKLFCDCYGLSIAGRVALVDTMVKRLQVLVDYMLSEADNGNPQFQRNIEDGHHLSYLQDIQYLNSHEKEITDFISNH
ncbi:aminoglycoside phosphotransferase family protein [uncultured Vibrio sp.]|uniref:phosphotransferase n=1 Tax=uncultured Vibrio sp. TaxID=114054 RepID=UPI0025FE78BC|nr:aminoglycoside phosphotransferase family protein [uncultured Vibrio sp.]